MSCLRPSSVLRRALGTKGFDGGCDPAKLSTSCYEFDLWMEANYLEQEGAKGPVGVELWNSQAATHYRSGKPTREASCGLLSLCG